MQRRKGSNQVNFRDVARSLGVSAMTVYRVANQNPNVGRATRTRVIEALNRYGFYTHRRAKKIKVLFDFTKHEYLTHYGRRLMENIASHEYLCVATDHRAAPAHFMEQVAECDAAVFVSIPDEALIRRVREANPDLYTITISTQSSADVTISPNNTLGGELAARHLHAMGHRHVAVHLSDAHPTRMERYKAFYAELKLLDPDCRIDRIQEKKSETTERVLRTYFDTTDTSATAILFLSGAFAEEYRTRLAGTDPVRYGELSVMTFDCPEDLEYKSLHYDFDRIEFRSPELLDWAEYYITNRPMMKKRTPIHTCTTVRLVVTGSVRAVEPEDASADSEAAPGIPRARD